MTLITAQAWSRVPTYVLNEAGTLVECRKVDDAELSDLVGGCGKWLLYAPGVPERAPVLDRIARALSDLQHGRDHRVRYFDEADGAFELGVLTYERIDLAMQLGGRTLYASHAEATDEDGTALDVAVVVIAPDRSPQVNVRLLLD